MYTIKSEEFKEIDLAVKTLENSINFTVILNNDKYFNTFTFEEINKTRCFKVDENLDEVLVTIEILINSNGFIHKINK